MGKRLPGKTSEGTRMAVKDENQPRTDIWQTILASAKTLRFEIVVLFLAFVLVLAGVYFLKSTTQSDQITVIDEKESSQSGEVVVDISGAVVKVGVYKFQAGARIGEAIEKAGGFSSDADRGWIDKNLNLAAKISDGAKIYVPKKEESAAGSSTLGVKTSGAINVNTASLKELDTLAGIGPVTGQKIIDGRPYSAIEDLLTRKIVSASTFEKIKNQISVF